MAVMSTTLVTGGFAMTLPLGASVLDPPLDEM